MSLTQKYKNVTAYGSELLKMNSSTYALRRKVIDVIYQINDWCREADLPRLPRIEVRIVTECECTDKGKIAGYAYTGNLIIHIPTDTLDFTELKFQHVVFHEVLHAIGFPHKDKCPLMHPYIPKKLDRDEQWYTLGKYLREYAESK